MEKLIVAIIQSAHAKKLKEALLAEGIRLTEVGSRGGFLGKKSLTMFMGVKENEVSKVLDAIKKHSRKKDVFIAGESSGEPGTMLQDVPLIKNATQIQVGGALVFVIPVDETLRI